MMLKYAELSKQKSNPATDTDTSLSSEKDSDYKPIDNISRDGNGIKIDDTNKPSLGSSIENSNSSNDVITISNIPHKSSNTLLSAIGETTAGVTEKAKKARKRRGTFDNEKAAVVTEKKSVDKSVEKTLPIETIETVPVI